MKFSDPEETARHSRIGLFRWLRFVAVGGGGFLVQISVLGLLNGALGLHYLPAAGIAVESAVLHNFIWHRRWTWRDRGGGETFRRLVRFHAAVGGVSLGGNLTLMALLVGVAELPVVPSNIAAVACCGMVNYLLCDRSIFVDYGERLSSNAETG